MREIPSGLYESILEGDINIRTYATVTLSDGTVFNLTPADFMEGGVSITDSSCDKFSVGNAVGKQATLKIANFDYEYDDYSWLGATFDLISVVGEPAKYFYDPASSALLSTTTGEVIGEEGEAATITWGRLYCTAPATSGQVIEITAVDGMYKFDTSYTGTYPATISEIVDDACQACGIVNAVGTLHFGDTTISECPESQTYRSIIQYAAALEGKNVRLNTAGELEFVCWDLDKLKARTGDFEVSQSSIVDLTKGTDEITITGVRVTTNASSGEVTELYGAEGYVMEISGNPFAEGIESEVATYLGELYTGVAFRTVSVNIQCNPCYEPYDVAYVETTQSRGFIYKDPTDGKVLTDPTDDMELSTPMASEANYSCCPVTSVTFSTGGVTTLDTAADDPDYLSSSYVSPSASARIASSKAKAAAKAYASAVAQLTAATSSSRLVKENIEDISDEYVNRIIDRLRIVSFDFIEAWGGKHGNGVIAEEALDVCPELVDIPDGYNEDEFDPDKKSQVPTFTYTGLIPIMLRKIQMQEAEINTLKAQVDTLGAAIEIIGGTE